MSQPQPPASLSQFSQGLDALWRRCDMAFAQVAVSFPKEVRCGSGCDDCCRAVFDLTPAEALALALAFRRLPRNARREALRRAEKAEAEFDQVARRALNQAPEERLLTFSRARVVCPLLEKGRCLLYAARPLTCRLYGIPVASGDGAHVCPRSGFDQGQSYPTADWDQVQAELERLGQAALELIPQLGPERRDLARVLHWAQAQALTLEALEA